MKEWYDADPLKTFSNSVYEAESNVIIIPKKFAQDMVKAITDLQENVVESRGYEIWGFYEDKYPIYTNRSNSHPELSFIMTVDEANGLVTRLKEIEKG